MKKFYPLLFVALIVATTSVSAQDYQTLTTSSTEVTDVEFAPKRSYTNFAFVSQKLTFGYADFSNTGIDRTIKSKYGAAITNGRTYFLHKKNPIAGMVRIGVDATWVDLNYGYYEMNNGGSKELFQKVHQAEIGVQVGPSVNINPLDKLQIHTYFRFAPTYSAIYNVEQESVLGSYASFFVAGGCVSYGKLGLGVESRWGGAKYKAIEGDIMDDESENSGLPNKIKVKTSGVRVYFSLRF